MNNEIDIENIKIAAGKRTYFVDVKLTREGAKYLKISESKRLDTGEYERHRVMIFDENINGFVEALRTALRHFPNYKKPEQKSKMDLIKENFANAYKPWTDEEDLRLTDFFSQGMKPKEISEILQRNTGAISSRIEKLELKQKYS